MGMPIRLTLWAWGLAWGWCYPGARAEVAEAVRARARGPRQAVGVALGLPTIARAADPNRGRARELVLWLNLVGLLVTAAAVASSMVITGNFLLESADVPGGPEHPSGYFNTAAGAFLAIVAVDLTAIGAVRFRRGTG